ncbi:MAG: tetratricopeptide repeat protein [Armatimonas sp.]
MKQLTLRHEAQPDGTDAKISVIFQQSPTHTGSIAGPFPFNLDYSTEEREKVRWYLEEYLMCPLGAYRNRAEEAEEVLKALGEKLFHAVFSQPECHTHYVRVADDLSNARIVVQANSAAGIALPWEAIRDPQRTYGQLAYEANAFVRGESDLDRVPVALEGDRLNVLLTISRPRDEEDVPFQSVARHLLQAFASVRERVHIELLRPATFEELSRRLQERPGHYHVFHFDGHGVYHPDSSSGTYRYGEAGGSLYFEDGARIGREVGTALAAAKVPVVLLNACQSGMTRAEDNVVSLGNDLLRSGASGVVAMSYTVYVQTAAQFMRRLYERLSEGDTLAGAHKKGIASLHDNSARRSAIGTDEHLKDWIVPVLFEAAQVTPLPKKVGLNLGGGSEESTGAEEMNVPATPLTGFYGRDNVILRLERIYQNNTVALLWGMAGVGKTTTASEFARWRGLTGALEGPIFFFSFEHRKTLADVLREIGTFVQPLLKANGVEWEHLTPQRQRRCVLDLLTQIPCFLIWDNFEPVSGFPTGTKSDWTEEEQAELKQFLLDLAGRKGTSKVLITSRRQSEPLLTDFPTVPLGGLSHSEAWELAGAIFEKQGLNSAKIQQLPQFDDLLQFMKGNPLTLLVILPLLKDGRNPEALLRELEAGTLKLPEGDSVEQGRDKSLAASLTYRFNALPEADVARLSVLGLFQGFVNAQVLTLLSAQENAPIELRGASIEEWIGILSSATEIGLGDVVGSVYFTIHPALPWFFQESLIKIYGDSLQELRYCFVSVFSEYALWISNQFENHTQFSVTLLNAEETNMLHIFYESRKQSDDIASLGILYALRKLWMTKGLWFKLRSFIENIIDEISTDDKYDIPENVVLGVPVLGIYQQVLAYFREFDNSEIILGKLKSYYESEKDDRNIAVCLHQLGMIAQERRNFDNAESYFLQSLDIKQKIGEDGGAATSLHHLGMIAQYQYDLKKAEDYYARSLAIKQRLGDEFGESLTLHQMGAVAGEQRVFRNAEDYYTRSLAIKQRLGDEFGEAVTLHQLGTSCQENRMYDKAENYYRKSLEVKKRIGDKHGMAGTLHNLGILAQNKRNFSEASEWFRQSLDIKNDIGDVDGRATTLHQLGRNAYELCDFDEAEKWYLESLNIANDTGNDKLMALISHNLGMSKQKELKIDEAEGWYQESLRKSEKIGDEYSTAQTYYQIGTIAQQRMDFNEAESNFKKAEGILKNFEDEFRLNIVRLSLVRLEQLKQESSGEKMA